MNRLVIIGNGFDLAHGLPTGYNHFINDFWRNFRKCLNTEDYKSILEINESFVNFLNYGEINSFKDFKANILEYAKDYGFSFHDGGNQGILQQHQNRITLIKYKNYFFKIINELHSVQNWIDIENLYFKILKDCLQDTALNKYHTDVTTLNKEFEQIKVLFEKYLSLKVNDKYDFKSPPENSNLLTKLFDVQTRKSDLYLKEFSYRDQGEVKRNLSQSRLSHVNEEGEQCLFLNFNYTSTADTYCDTMNAFPHIYGGCRIIQIHGRLNDPENKINFGFGDEMDDDYKKIENKDDNEYLRNIKSFQYLQNSNYKNMLDFVESEIFQVFIMGHSCGLSDRILLNKIFEHHNCKSIKVFYYKNGDWDNYTEIIQNISRHFNKKEMMREKIVNKTLCQPLPQEIRFKEKNNGS